MASMACIAFMLLFGRIRQPSAAHFTVTVIVHSLNRSLKLITVFMAFIAFIAFMGFRPLGAGAFRPLGAGAFLTFVAFTTRARTVVGARYAIAMMEPIGG